MTTVAIRHRHCGQTSTPPAWVLEHLDRGTWKGGLDCLTCHMYRPVADFDLIGESTLQRVKDLPPSGRATSSEAGADPAR